MSAAKERRQFCCTCTTVLREIAKGVYYSRAPRSAAALLQRQQPELLARRLELRHLALQPRGARHERIVGERAAAAAAAAAGAA